MKKEVQLEFISFELGEEAGLVTFARKFRELFAERIGVDSQKDACLKLYRKYAKIETSKNLKQGPYAPRGGITQQAGAEDALFHASPRAS